MSFLGLVRCVLTCLGVFALLVCVGTQARLTIYFHTVLSGVHCMYPPSSPPAMMLFVAACLCSSLTDERLRPRARSRDEA